MASQGPKATYRVQLIYDGLLMAARRPGLRADQVFAMGQLAQRWQLGMLLENDERLTRAVWEAAEIGMPWPE